MNAKNEFLEEVDGKEIKCAIITNFNEDHTWLEEDEKTTFCLKVNYNVKDYDDFLKHLDYEYDDGYGTQELFGIIWFEDGTWAERYEYDGSEWWEHKKCPKIPVNLIFNNAPTKEE